MKYLRPQSESYYDLQSKRKSENMVLDENFALVKTKKKEYTYKGNPCKIVQITERWNIKGLSVPLNSILKRNSKTLSHTQLWSNWSENISSIQLPSIIQGMQTHLENLEQTDKREYNPYMVSLFKDFLKNYKEGTINIPLSNKVNIKELNLSKQSKNIKKVSFDTNFKLAGASSQ